MIVQEESLLPSLLRLPGEHISSSVWVPISATYVTVSYDNRQAWQRLGAFQDVLELILEINIDGIWRILGGCTADTQPSYGRDGQLKESTTLKCRLPRERIPQPQVRSVLRCMSPCEGAIHLQFEDTPLPIRAVVEHHSVTYDNDNEATATSGTSVTIGAFAVANNVNRCMIVGGCSYSGTVGNAVVASVSHNGSTAGWSQVIDTPDATNTTHLFLWRKVAVDVVSATVVVTFAGGCTELAANALSAYDVHQTTPMGTPVGIDGGTIASPGTATSNVAAATDDLVYDIVYSYGGITSGVTVGAGQAQRANAVVITYAGARTVFGASTEPGATTVTMSWTLTGDTEDVYWMQVSCAIKVAAAAVTYIPRSFMLNQAVKRAALY